MFMTCTTPVWPTKGRSIVPGDLVRVNAIYGDWIGLYASQFDTAELLSPDREDPLVKVMTLVEVGVVVAVVDAATREHHNVYVLCGDVMGWTIDPYIRPLRIIDAEETETYDGTI